MNARQKITKKVSLILPYYGVFPKYFDVWVSGAEKNTWIDFYIITDNKDAIKYCRGNVHVVDMPFAEIKRRIEKVSNKQICLKQPYKLCDYKPTYRAIFNDLIQDSEFWGYIDPDVVIGDLSLIINDDTMSRFDMIGGCSPYYAIMSA